MKPILLVAATGLLACVSTLPALTQDSTVYLDDRSSPEQLIRSLYNAINRHEFGRAYSYFETPPAPTFEDYERGFGETAEVELVTGLPQEDAGAGTVHYTLPVAIRSLSKSGEARVFAGCYTLTLSSPSAQTTPFSPLRIEAGRLGPAEGELEDALPARCDETEEPRSEEALLIRRASEVFNSVFSRSCNASLIGEEAPQHHKVTYRASWAAEGAPDEEAHLFRFLCERGAYNELHAYLMMDSSGVIMPVTFATPEVQIDYEDGDSDKAAMNIQVIGFQTEALLINSEFDPETFTITSHAKWRGVGDAFSAGQWLFRQGRFSLVKYDLDPSTDGKIEPATILDYQTAP